METGKSGYRGSLLPDSLNNSRFQTFKPDTPERVG